MNYTQNEKIEQVTDSTMVVGSLPQQHPESHLSTDDGSLKSSAFHALLHNHSKVSDMPFLSILKLSTLVSIFLPIFASLNISPSCFPDRTSFIDFYPLSIIFTKKQIVCITSHKFPPFPEITYADANIYKFSNTYTVISNGLISSSRIILKSAIICEKYLNFGSGFSCPALYFV